MSRYTTPPTPEQVAADRARTRAWRAANPKSAKRHADTYRANNAHALAAAQRRYVANHPERRRVTNHEWNRIRSWRELVRRNCATPLLWGFNLGRTANARLA